jgi:enterochelin esterase-like enzyme
MRVFQAAAFVALVLVVPGFANAQNIWVKPPSTETLKNTPGLQHHTFESEFMKTEVGYNVILPPSYETATDKRYPVVYWLHGGGGNESSSLYIAKYWQELYDSDEHDIGEVILVFPNGYRSSYMDHVDGKIMVESMIIKELIPRIDSQFRTIATGEGRAAHGFSMGSSGSLKFAIRYPEMFCGAVAGGGGAVDLERATDPFIVNIMKRNFDGDPELIRKNNTYFYLEKNQAVLRDKGTRILLVCGDADTWMKSAVTFQAELKEKGIPCELLSVPGVAHSARKVYEAKGRDAVLFQDRMFKGK